jgi:hypothetical protein
MAQGRLCLILWLAAWPLLGCVQQSTATTSAQEDDKSLDQASSTSNRRRTTIYTTDALASPALAENAVLSGAFTASSLERSTLADGARRLGAYAAADFYEFTHELEKTQVLSPARSAGLLRPLACVVSTDDAAVVRERELALKLIAADAQEAVRLLSEYGEALASAPHDCRLLAGWSVAVLRSAQGSERTRAQELAVRRVLEFANGHVAPSRMSSSEMYATLAQYFTDRGDVIGAIAALEYALHSSSGEGDATQRSRLARWQERLLASSSLKRHGPS